jgi:hypothetical protein
VCGSTAANASAGASPQLGRSAPSTTTAHAPASAPAGRPIGSTESRRAAMSA